MDIIEQNATSRFLLRHVETFSESVSWMNRRCARENIACGNWQCEAKWGSYTAISDSVSGQQQMVATLEVAGF